MSLVIFIQPFILFLDEILPSRKPQFLRRFQRKTLKIRLIRNLYAPYGAMKTFMK